MDRQKYGWIGGGQKYRWIGGGRVKKNEGAKRSSKTIDIVSYALKVSVNVCSPFQVIRHI